MRLRPVSLIRSCASAASKGGVTRCGAGFGQAAAGAVTWWFRALIGR